MLEIYVPH
jgi:hypothetical protein